VKKIRKPTLTLPKGGKEEKRKKVTIVLNIINYS